MLKKRFIYLVCKLLSLTTIVWMIVTVLYIVFVFIPKNDIPSEYLFFTISVVGIKVGSDRIKKLTGESDAGNTAKNG